MTLQDAWRRMGLRPFREDVDPVQLVIQGEPASKANQRKFVLIGGSPRSIKSAKARAWSDSAAWQLKAMKLPMLPEGDVHLSIRMVYASRRPDMDESLVLDVLQGFVYRNDRAVKQRAVTHALDAKSPRVEICAYALEAE